MSVGPKFTDKVTTVPADWANSVTDLVYTVFNQAATVVDARNALGLGTLALENSNNVSITGGVIDGVSIGPLNPMTARFTVATVTQLTPVLPGNLTSKQYVDTSISNAINNIIAGQITPALLAGKVNKSGDTMTGPLILYEDPASTMEAATKRYVDNTAATAQAAAIASAVAQAKTYTDTQVAAAIVTAEAYTDTLKNNLANASNVSLGAAMIGYNNTTVFAALNGLTNPQPPKEFYAGPVSGGAAAPAFRNIVLSDLTFAGQANGIATLDGTGKVPLAQLPSGIGGGLFFRGLWNAATNTPTLASGVGAQGDMWKVSVAGTTNLDGISTWNVGDVALFDGTKWGKLDGAATEVTSVAGRTGDVVLTYQDIGGLSTVAHTGSFTDLLNIPVGSGTQQGILQVGQNITVTAGTISIPYASAGAAGVIKVGSNLSIDGSGVLSANAQPLTPATTTVLGGVIVPTTGGLAVDASGNITMKPATASTIGGVIVGAGLSVNGSGVISVAGGSAVNSVQNEGTGTGLVDNNGISGGIATIRSLAGGPGVSIVASGDNKTLTINVASAVTSVNGQTGDVTINAANLPGLSVVGRTGSYLDLLSVPTTFNPPIATASVLGGIKVGSGLAIDASGVLSLNAPLLPATTTTLGGVIVPASGGLTVDGSGNIGMRAATASLIGGVIVGNGLTVTSGTASLVTASASQLGGIKVGSGLAIDGTGVLSVTSPGGVSSLNSLTGALSLTAGSNIVITPSGSNIQIASTGIGEAPNDGNLYGRQNLTWTLIPSVGSAITSVTGQTGTGAVLLVESSPPPNSAIIKSLVAGNNVTLTDNAGLITIAAALPAGTVATVNSIAPDGSGNVTLTAANVNALPTAGGTMSGTINMASNKITNLPTPSASGDAVPLSYITGITAIDAGTF